MAGTQTRHEIKRIEARLARMILVSERAVQLLRSHYPVTLPTLGASIARISSATVVDVSIDISADLREDLLSAFELYLPAVGKSR